MSEVKIISSRMRLPYAVCHVVLRLSTKLYTCKSYLSRITHNCLNIELCSQPPFTFVFKTHICEKANKRQKENRALVKSDNRLMSPVNKSSD